MDTIEEQRERIIPFIKEFITENEDITRDEIFHKIMRKMMGSLSPRLAKMFIDEVIKGEEE